MRKGDGEEKRLGNRDASRKSGGRLSTSKAETLGAGGAVGDSVSKAGEAGDAAEKPWRQLREIQSGDQVNAP